LKQYRNVNCLHTKEAAMYWASLMWLKPRLMFAQQPEFNVLLVDDTVTTGATLDECAKILKLYGAGSVFAITATASRLSVLEK
jgi:adenine/guanine phosphoribosyltransferase-like PRPP-binding protein